MSSSKRDSLEEAMARSYEGRKMYWGQVGRLYPDVLTHLINPSFSGGPMWPSFRQAFCRVDAESTVILASDGLSDPYDDGDGNDQGFQLECYVETEDLDQAQRIEEMKDTWAFRLLYEVSQNMAAHGNVRPIIEKYGILSMELYELGLPEEWEDEEGRSGILLGIDSPTITTHLSLPAGDVRLISIKLLTRRELDYAVQNGTNGRLQLAELFKQQGSYHRSTLHRNSVV